MRVLALKVGTSTVKAVVLDVERAAQVGVMARASCTLDHTTPETAEVPPERLWSAVTSAARQAMRGADSIDGIGLTCLTPGLILLDSRDRPLTPIWTHLDRRARAAARQVWAGVGTEFLATTGNRPLPGGISAVCYRQVLTEDPYLIRAVRRYLHVNSWLGLRLTGEVAMDPANASFSGLYNTLTDRQWSSRWCDYFNVDQQWLPPVVCASTTLGPLRPEVAVELGVPPGVPVKLGTSDTSSALLAANLKPGELLHSDGATQLLAAIVAQPVPDARRLTQHLGVGEDCVHVAHNPVSGESLDWVHQLCFRDQPREYFHSKTIEEARRRETRVSLDPPYLGGDPLEIEAHRAAFRDLTLRTDRLDFLAALLCEMRRQHLRATEALGVGRAFSRIVLTGSGAGLVQQVLPDYYGQPVERLEECALRGIAYLFRQS